jgi:hypothetical protein
MATRGGTIVLSAKHDENPLQSQPICTLNPGSKATMFVVIGIEHPNGSGDVAYMLEDVVVAKALKF